MIYRLISNKSCFLQLIEPYYFVSLHGKSVDMTDERYIEKCEKIAEDYWKQASVKEFDEASPVIADIFAQLSYLMMIQVMALMFLNMALMMAPMSLKMALMADFEVRNWTNGLHINWLFIPK